MITSTNIYNANPANGIILEGNAHNSRYCNVASIHYPGAEYHYEFFFDEDHNQLLACIHCNHIYPNAQLATDIDALFLPIIQPNLHHYGFSIINFPLIDSVKGNHTSNSHIINIPCFNNHANSAQHNADLMFRLIKISIAHI